MFRICFCLLMVLTSIGVSSLSADEIAKIVLTSPSPHQVVQREGFESGSSHEHNVTGPTLGFADVEVEWTAPEGMTGRWEFRTIPLVGTIKNSEVWMQINPEAEEKTLHGPAEVNAGGWYRLELRCVQNDKTIAQAVSSRLASAKFFWLRANPMRPVPTTNC